MLIASRESEVAGGFLLKLAGGDALVAGNGGPDAANREKVQDIADVELLALVVGGDRADAEAAADASATEAAVFLFGAFAVFSIDLLCLPLHRYRKLLTSALNGRTHTGTFEFKEAEAETSMVDGVSCRGLIFLGEPDKHGSREQRFYWDEQKPLPDFRAGDQITLKYTGKNIIGWQTEGV